MPTLDTDVPVQAAGAAGQWRRALLAAALPALGALAFLSAAALPHEVLADTMPALILLLVAEVLAQLLSLARATWTADATWRHSLSYFAVVLMVFLLPVALQSTLGLGWLTVAPMLLWISLSYFLGFWLASKEPMLAREQALAVVDDRSSLFDVSLGLSLIGLPIVIGMAQVSAVAALFAQASPHLPAPFLVLGGAYLLLCAASAGYVHLAEFHETGRRLLDRPWVRALTIAGVLDRRWSWVTRVEKTVMPAVANYDGLSLWQRCQVLFSVATFKRWMRYTIVGGSWIWVVVSTMLLLLSPSQEQTSGGWLLMLQQSALLMSYCAAFSLFLAAIATLPLLVSQVLDNPERGIGFGFFLGMVLTCTLAISTISLLAWLW